MIPLITVTDEAGRTSLRTSFPAVGRLGAELPPAIRVTRKRIVAEIAAHHDMSVEEMTGPRQSRSYVHARQHAMYVMWQGGRASLSQIASAVGRTDHSTAHHGIRAHAKRHSLPLRPA